MTQATFWNPGHPKNDVVAHTPDETKYHYPDSRQGERMRAGMGGVVIPRANDDGTSKGFDGRVAGVVHVDPDAPDGGAVVDLSQVNGQSLYNAFAHSTYPHEVYYQLGVKPTAQQYQPQPQQAPEPPRVNPHVPGGTYVVPKAAEDGTQTLYQQPQGGYPVQPVPPMPPTGQPQVQQQQPAPMPAPAPVAPAPAPAPVAPAPAPMQQQPQYPPQPPYPQQPQQYQQPQPYYPPPPQDPAIAALTQQVAQLANVVGGMMQQQPVVPPGQYTQQQNPQSQLRTMPQGQQGMAPTPPMPPQPAAVPPRPKPIDDEEYQPRQSLREIEQHADMERQQDSGVIMGFETLEMKFINGPIPTKAKKEVYFQMPGMGTMSARYHEVVDGGSSVALVYDTRFEDGNQYLPPDMGEQQMRVSVPKLKKEWLCSSLGIHFNVGVLDIVVLIKHPEPDQEYVEDEDE